MKHSWFYFAELFFFVCSFHIFLNPRFLMDISNCFRSKSTILRRSRVSSTRFCARLCSTRTTTRPARIWRRYLHLIVMVALKSWNISPRHFIGTNWNGIFKMKCHFLTPNRLPARSTRRIPARSTRRLPSRSTRKLSTPTKCLSTPAWVWYGLR